MSKKRLLVIEDDVDVAEMLVVYFTSQDYEVLNATSGAEGIGVDAKGNVYGGVVRRRMLERHIRESK